MHEEYQYLHLLKDAITEGTPNPVYGSEERFRQGVIGRTLRFDLTNGKIPLFTTRRVPWKGSVAEMLWFLKGDPNIDFLAEHNAAQLWAPWAYRKYAKSCQLEGVRPLSFTEYTEELKNPQSSLRFQWFNPPYGPAWRNWWHYTSDGLYYVTDQIALAQQRLKTTPHCNHNIVTAFNPALMPDAAENVQDAVCLPPCHVTFQLLVRDSKLTLVTTQRSWDLCLGTVANIFQYALLAHMFARSHGFEPGELVYFASDCHVYDYHIEIAKQQLEREPMPFPTVELNPEVRDVTQFTLGDIRVAGYQSHPAIKYPLFPAGK